LTLAESAIVLGDRVLVAMRHCGRRGRARLACLWSVWIALKLQLELVDVVQDLRVQLFDHRRIAREPRWVELLHLLLEIIDLFLSGGIALGGLAKLAQFTHTLLDEALHIRRVGSVLRRVRVSRRAVALPAGVDVEVRVRTAASAAERTVDVLAAHWLILAAATLAVRATLAVAALGDLISLPRLNALTALAILSSLLALAALPSSLLALALLSSLSALLAWLALTLLA
jgi:hypothetical protein